MPAIEVRELTRRFGEFTAVDRLSFDVEPGEIFGFLGANGAGKSTTIRMLCGLLRPTSGTALVGGIDVSADPEGVKRRIGYMSQRFSLYERLTIDRQHPVLRRHLRAPRQGARRAAGIRSRHGGPQRAGRTRARAIWPVAGGNDSRSAAPSCTSHAIVFLDEPTGGVDPLSRRRFWDLIGDLSQSGTTVLVTTHYLDEAEHCHRLALIHAGKLAALGNATSLKQRFSDRPILEIQATDPVAAMSALERLPGVEKTSLFGTAVHAVLRDRSIDVRRHPPRAGTDRERRHGRD